MVSVHCVSASVTISQSVCLSAKFQKKVADKFSRNNVTSRFEHDLKQNAPINGKYFQVIRYDTIR